MTPPSLPPPAAPRPAPPRSSPGLPAPLEALRRGHRRSWLGLALALAASSAAAQQPPAAPSELDFFAVDDALERMTSLASSRALSLRESPGSVIVITREEILESGARDLFEVLQRVPGLSFTADNQGILALGVRGLMALEGRALVLLDGQVLNEPSYGTMAFGDRVPLDIIESIEVMRGPAFALYGETAELGVIHVHTRGAQTLQGASVAVRHARTSRTGVQRSVSLSVADRFESVPGLSASVSAALGESAPSDARYVDASGGAVDLGLSNRRQPLHLNLGVAYRDLQVRVLHDAYRTTSLDGIATISGAPVTNDFLSTIADARYEARLGERLTLSPRLTYRRQQPWRDTDPDSPGYYAKTVERYVGRLTLAYHPLERLHLFLGTDAYVERARLDGSPEHVGRGYQRAFGDALSLTLRNAAAFTEVSLATPWALLTAGLRHERHSQFGAVWVPRAALTRAFEHFHAKLLYSGAFRAPMLENIAVNPELRAEHAHFWEAEAGYRFSDALSLSANVFDVSIDDTILYFVHPETEEDAYRNGEGTGSRGFELEGRLRTGRLAATLAYAFATAAGKNRVEDFAVPGDDGVLLGFARHTLTLHTSLRLTETLTLAPSLVLLGARTGLTGVDAAGNFSAERLAPTPLVHLFLGWRDAGVRGLELGLGVRNLLDARFPMPQAYNAGHAPLPGPTREWVGRASFTLPFD